MIKDVIVPQNRRRESEAAAQSLVCLHRHLATRRRQDAPCFREADFSSGVNFRFARLGGLRSLEAVPVYPGAVVIRLGVTCVSHVSSTKKDSPSDLRPGITREAIAVIS
jgi:hypothetical protein